MSLSPVEDTSVINDMDPIRLNLAEQFLNAQEEEDESAADSENMRVFVRVRPLLKDEISQGFSESVTIVTDTTLRARAPVDSVKFKNVHSAQDFVELFTFTKAFKPEIDQFTLFEETMKDPVHAFIDGHNSLIFAYGNSGSGKTYTMQGSEREPGIIPLTVQLLFEAVKEKFVESPVFKPEKLLEVVDLQPTELEAELKAKKELLQLLEHEDSDSSKSDKSSTMLNSIFLENSEINDTIQSSMSDYSSLIQMKNFASSSVALQGETHFSVWVSFYEVYNERVYDLLQPFTQKKRCKLNLGEDKRGNIYVKGLREVFVSSSDEVFKLLKVGKKNQKIASTKLNYKSSRSHCIFNIKVVRARDPNDLTTVSVNNLSFCDLAGSERCCKTENKGMRLKEAGKINNSLLVLGRCLQAVRHNQSQKEKLIIPFRESQLTRVFSGFFTGRGKALMIVNISPSSFTFDETLNALKFSAVARELIMIDNHMTMKLSSLSEDFEKSKARLSLEKSNMSFDENGEMNETYSLDQEIEERDKMIVELIAVAKDLESQLKESKKEILDMESKLRKEIGQEWRELYEKAEDSARQRYEEMRQLYEAYSNRRMDAILESLRQQRDQSNSSSDDESSESEAEQAEPSRGTPAAAATTPEKPQTKGEIPVAAVMPFTSPVVTKTDIKDTNPDAFACATEIFPSQSFNADIIQKLGKQRAEELEEKDEEIANLHTKICELENLLRNQAKQRSEELIIRDSEIEKLKFQVQDLNTIMFNQAKQRQEELVGKDEEIHALQFKMNELNEIIRNKLQELRAKDMSLQRCDTVLSEKDVIVLKLQEELQDRSNTIKSLEQRCCEQETSMENSAQTLGQKERLIQKMLVQITDMETTLKTAEKHIEEKEMALQECTKQLEEKKAEIEELGSEVKALKEVANEKTEPDVPLKVTAVSTVEIQTDDTHEETKKNIENLRNELNSMKDIIAQKDHTISELTKKIDELKNNLEKKDAEIDAAKKASELNVTQLQQDLKDAKLMVEQKEKEIQVLQNTTELDELKGSLDKKNAEIDAAKKEHDELKENLEKKDAEINTSKTAFQASVTKLQEDVKNATLMLERKEKEIQALQNTTELDELKKSLGMKDAEISAAKKELEEKSKSLEKRDAEIDSASKELSELKNSLLQKDAANDAASKASEASMTKLQEDLMASTLVIEQKEKEIEAVQKSAEKEVKSLQDELSEKTRSLKEKEQELLSALKASENYQKEMNKALEGLVEKDEELSSLKKVLESHQKEIKLAKESFAETEKDIENLRKDSENYRDEMNKARDCLAEKEKELENLNKALESLQKETSMPKETVTVTEKKLGNLNQDDQGSTNVQVKETNQQEVLPKKETGARKKTVRLTSTKAVHTVQKESAPVPGTPFVSKLRTRVARKNYRDIINQGASTSVAPAADKKQESNDDDALTEQPKKKKKMTAKSEVEPKEAVPDTKPPSIRQSRRAKVSSVVAPSPTKRPSVTTRNATGRVSKIKASTLSYLSPTKASVAKSTVTATRRKRALFAHESTPKLVTTPPPPEEKSPVTAQKTAQLMLRQINKKRIRAQN